MAAYLEQKTLEELEKGRSGKIKNLNKLFRVVQDLVDASQMKEEKITRLRKNLQKSLTELNTLMKEREQLLKAKTQKTDGLDNSPVIAPVEPKSIPKSAVDKSPPVELVDMPITLAANKSNRVSKVSVTSSKSSKTVINLKSCSKCNSKFSIQKIKIVCTKCKKPYCSECWKKAIAENKGKNTASKVCGICQAKKDKML